MGKLIRSIGWVLGLSLLTALTQVGGIVVLLWLPLRRWLKKRLIGNRWHIAVRAGSFLLFWLLWTFGLIPPIARQLGREALPVFGQAHLRPFHLGYCLLNRHYVRPELKALLIDASEKIQSSHPGTVVAYLDANFPFWNGFRLIPHLSHNDGRKADLAFFFQDENGRYLARKALNGIAYGGSVVPLQGETDQPAACAQKGYWQYNLLTDWLPQRKDRSLDASRTQALIRLLARDPRVGKLFLEPHLKTRLGLAGYAKIRYHGCQAVRHDDHLHVQL